MLRSISLGSLGLVVLAAIAGCAHDADGPVREAASPKKELFSDPEEYRDRPISRAAGEAYFGETGLGDPYAVGFPYPILLAMMRAYPEELGADFRALSAKFGMLSRGGDAFALPVGFHLTTDPNTHVSFLMTNCALCHTERMRLPQGEIVVTGLGNRRIRVHAYEGALLRIAQDPGFTVARMLPLAGEAARAHDLAWSPEYAKAIVTATVSALKERARARGEGVARLEHGMPGRVATIESFAIALGITVGHPIAMPKNVGWSRIPDVRNARFRDTLSFDGVGTGAPTALVVEADIAAGARTAWFDTHRHIGTSLYMFLRDFERKLPFPGAVDGALAHRGHDLFVAKCSRCHGRYEDGGAVAYREHVVPLEIVGTDPARSLAVTHDFLDAANSIPIARGITRADPTGGYVAPPLVDVWARGPYGHAGQWPTLRVLATPPASRPRRYVVAPSADYDLEAVGVRTRSGGSPSGDEYAYDGDAPGFDVGGHPFLADLGADDAAAVIEFLKGI